MGKHLAHTPVLFEQVREYLAYDAGSGLFTWIANPGYQHKVGKIAGRKTDRGYITIEFGGKSYAGHRLAWFFAYGSFPEGIVDHINCVADDNRLVNLRLATAFENARNRRANKGRTLPKGVYYDTRDRRFRAGIRVNNIKHRLGSFDCAEDAAEAYRVAALSFHGEFARTE